MRGALRREEGATAIIVAICLLMLFGAGAIAVDLGSAWDTKRALVVDTDAAALAGARALSAPGGDCTAAENTAADFLSQNLGQTVSVSELKSGSGGSLICDATNRRVTVAWTGEAQQTLSGAIGSDGVDVLSSSTAKAVDVVAAGGLRPVAACLFDGQIQNWLSGGAGNTYRFDLSGSATNCGGAPGNWGWTCFDRSHGPYRSDGPTGCDGNNGQVRIESMLAHGYSGTIDLGGPPTSPPAPDDEDCDPETAEVDPCDGKPGSLGGSMSDILGDLVASGEEFPILGIYSYTDDGGGNGNGNGNGNNGNAGGGANATTNPAAFIGVRLTGFQVTGGMSDRYLEFELVNLFQEGTSHILTEGQPTTTSVFLCGGDGGETCS